MHTDDELLAAAAAGDADAFAAVFRRHERAVTRFAIHRCASPDEVADAVSETFLVAFGSAGRYRPEHPSALPWLLGIAVRIVLHQQRAARRRLRLLGRARGRGRPQRRRGRRSALHHPERRAGYAPTWVLLARAGESRPIQEPPPGSVITAVEGDARRPGFEVATPDVARSVGHPDGLDPGCAGGG